MTNTTPSIEVLPTDESFAVPATADSLDKAAAALRGNAITVHVADTITDARRIVLGLLPVDKVIFASTSATLRESGLTADIDDSGTFISLRTQQADWDLRARFDELRATRSAPDVVVGSVHAVTEDGRLVTASASGSQLASYAFGAAQAIWVVGAQKVVPDLETAMRRVETYSYPKEDLRAQQVYGQRSAIRKILITNSESMPGRATVVLVREALGY